MLTAEERRERRKQRILANADDRLQKICTDTTGAVRSAPCFEGPTTASGFNRGSDELAMEDVLSSLFPREDNRVTGTSPEYEKKHVFAVDLLLNSSSLLFALAVGFVLAAATLYEPELYVLLLWLLALVGMSTLRLYFKQPDPVMSHMDLFKNMILSGIDPKIVKMIDISVILVMSIARDTTAFVLSFVISSVLLNALF